MIEGRENFGICNIGHLIYVVGGDCFEDQYIDRNISTCETYNILENKWTQICDLPDQYQVGITL